MKCSPFLSYICPGVENKYFIFVDSNTGPYSYTVGTSSYWLHPASWKMHVVAEVAGHSGQNTYRMAFITSLLTVVSREIDATDASQGLHLVLSRQD